MDKVYKDTVGFTIRADTNNDISTATGTTFEVKKPDGTTASWTATIEDTKYLEHVTESGDLDQAGKYMIQASLTLGAWVGEGETFELFVFDQFA